MTDTDPVVADAGPIRVSFMIEVEDLVAFIRLLQRRLNVSAAILGIAVMVVGSALAGILSDPFTGFFTLIVGGLLVFFAGTEFLDRWRVQRAGTRLIGSTASFVFDGAGIKAKTVAGEGKIEWSETSQLLKNNRVLVVKRGKSPIVWIPTRVLVTPEDELALIDFIEAHIGGADAAGHSEARAS